MKYAFCCSCNMGYMFCVNSSMNLLAKMGSTIDWEIAYDNVPDQYRENMSKAFPFKVHWTPIPELYNTTQKRADRFWISTWLMTAKAIDKYDAVCNTQGDLFIMSNMDSLFEATAKSEIIIITEHFNTNPTLEDLYKRDTPLTHRSECALTDQFIICNKKYKYLFTEVAKWMDKDKSTIKGEQNHPIIALNNVFRETIPFNKVIPLERHIWTFQKGVFDMNLRLKGDYLYNDRNIRIKAWHNRWWQKGKVLGELQIAEKSNNDTSIFRKNATLIRDFMAKYNDMTPETRIDNYEKTIF